MSKPIYLVGSEISDYHYDSIHDLCAQGLQISEALLVESLQPWFDVHTEVDAKVVATWPHFYLMAKWSEGARTMHIVPEIDPDVYDIATESGDDGDITAFDLAIESSSAYDVAIRFEMFRDTFEYIVTSDEIERLRSSDYKHSPAKQDIAMSIEYFKKAVLDVTKLSANRFGILIVTPESGDGEEDFDVMNSDRIVIA